ncbi:MAG TPA: hypothetical protein VMX16_04565 [Terriglobia bacterium]|nr:hypothetical protein [Terriglobia bacterium]
MMLYVEGVLLNSKSRSLGCLQDAALKGAATKPADGRVTVVEVRAHFVTAIHMPEAVNSVAVGDPSWFKVEHSER